MTPFQQPTHRVTPDHPSTRLSVPNDDDGDGLLMFLVFTTAVLTSTAAVVLIALLGEWWVFGFGLAIHAIMTAIVVLTIAQVMAGRHRSIADRDALPSTSMRPRSSPARSHPPARARRSLQPVRLRLRSSDERTTSLRKTTAGRMSRQWLARDVNKQNWPEGGALLLGSTASLAGDWEPHSSLTTWKRRGSEGKSCAGRDGRDLGLRQRGAPADS